MDYLKLITYNEITSLALDAKDELIISMPNLFDDLCETICECAKRVNDVRVIVDNSEESYRNGYGEIKGIAKLKKNGITVYNLKGNLVSFIISDNKGYYLFPHSRIFSAEKDLLYNAVRIDPLSIVILKSKFFNSIDQRQKYEIKEEIMACGDEFLHELADMVENDEITEGIKINELKTSEIEAVNEQLLLNPPGNPDLKRQIQVYTTKVQFAEFIFDGANIISTEVKIPPGALPFKNAEIKKKLKTKMKIFDNPDAALNMYDFAKFRREIDGLRREYLIPISSRKGKSVIKRENKPVFMQEMDRLATMLKELNNELLLIIDFEIEKSKKTIEKELRDFYSSNIPDHLLSRKGKELEESIRREAEKTLNAIEFPFAGEMIKNMKLHSHFYDLTVEDFRDSELLMEFAKKGIIRERDYNNIKDIVEMSNAVPVKKEY